MGGQCYLHSQISFPMDKVPFCKTYPLDVDLSVNSAML